jgi:hypothetical protein
MNNKRKRSKHRRAGCLLLQAVEAEHAQDGRPDAGTPGMAAARRPRLTYTRRISGHRNSGELHERLLARPGAAERLAQLRGETTALPVDACPTCRFGKLLAERRDPMGDTVDPPSDAYGVWLVCQSCRAEYPRPPADLDWLQGQPA